MAAGELGALGGHHMWIPPDDFGDQRLTPRGQYQVVVVNCVSGMVTTPLPDRTRWQLSRRTLSDVLDSQTVGELDRLASDMQRVTCFVDASAAGALLLSAPTHLESLESTQGSPLAAVALDDLHQQPVPLTALPRPVAQAITNSPITTLRGAVAAQILCHWTAQSFCSCGGSLAKQDATQGPTVLKHGEDCAIGAAAARVHLAGATRTVAEMSWWTDGLAWALEPLLNRGWTAEPFDIRPDFEERPEWLKGQPLLVRLELHRDEDCLTVWCDPGNGEAIFSATGPSFVGGKALVDCLLVEGIDLTPERVRALVPTA